MAACVLGLMSCTQSTQTRGSKTADDPACGLVDLSIVEQVMGDTDVETEGPGLASSGDDAVGESSCTVRRPQSTMPTVRVAVTDVDDEDAAVQRLREDTEDVAGTSCAPVDGDTGTGVLCELTTGVFAPGVSLDLVDDGRQVRVRIEGWTDTDAAQRAATARRAADQALAAVEARG